ncbi:hypothetical protein BDZ97DRAFT_1911468 [Flammula alnicola]|nr:hypothetical protein BDZ97DRAFT_1911468 [Flammula alnicola]
MPHPDPSQFTKQRQSTALSFTSGSPPPMAQSPMATSSNRPLRSSKSTKSLSSAFSSRKKLRKKPPIHNSPPKLQPLSFTTEPIIDLTLPPYRPRSPPSPTTSTRSHAVGAGRARGHVGGAHPDHAYTHAPRHTHTQRNGCYPDRPNEFNDDDNDDAASVPSRNSILDSNISIRHLEHTYTHSQYHPQQQPQQQQDNDPVHDDQQHNHRQYQPYDRRRQHDANSSVSSSTTITPFSSSTFYSPPPPDVLSSLSSSETAALFASASLGPSRSTTDARHPSSNVPGADGPPDAEAPHAPPINSSQSYTHTRTTIQRPAGDSTALEPRTEREVQSDCGHGTSSSQVDVHHLNDLASPTTTTAAADGTRTSASAMVQLRAAEKRSSSASFLFRSFSLRNTATSLSARGGGGGVGVGMGDLRAAKRRSSRRWYEPEPQPESPPPSSWADLAVGSPPPSSSSSASGGGFGSTESSEGSPFSVVTPTTTAVNTPSAEERGGAGAGAGAGNGGAGGAGGGDGDGSKGFALGLAMKWRRWSVRRGGPGVSVSVERRIGGSMSGSVERRISADSVQVDVRQKGEERGEDTTASYPSHRTRKLSKGPSARAVEKHRRSASLGDAAFALLVEEKLKSKAATEEAETKDDPTAAAAGRKWTKAKFILGSESEVDLPSSAITTPASPVPPVPPLPPPTSAVYSLNHTSPNPTRSQRCGCGHDPYDAHCTAPAAPAPRRPDRPRRALRARPETVDAGERDDGRGDLGRGPRA